MTFDDMPAGTVLRHQNTGTTYMLTVADDGLRQWVIVRTDGTSYVMPRRDMALIHDLLLVELVEKPAEPFELFDCDGDRWELLGPDRYGFLGGSDLVKSRAELDEQYGPLMVPAP